MDFFLFQQLSCLYVYDSGIPVPVRIRKQSRYTGVRRLALTYRAVGLPASDATGKFAQSWYTGFRVLRVKARDELIARKRVG